MAPACSRSESTEFLALSGLYRMVSGSPRQRNYTIRFTVFINMMRQLCGPLILAATAVNPALGQKMIAITNVTIIDGTDRPPRAFRLCKRPLAMRQEKWVYRKMSEPSKRARRRI